MREILEATILMIVKTKQMVRATKDVLMEVHHVDLMILFVQTSSDKTETLSKEDVLTKINAVK